MCYHRHHYNCVYDKHWGWSCQYHECNCFQNSEPDYKPQKPLEWSEEDRKRMVSEMMKDMKAYHGIEFTDVERQVIEDVYGKE